VHCPGQGTGATYIYVWGQLKNLGSLFHSCWTDTCIKLARIGSVSAYTHYHVAVAWKCAVGGFPINW
jgi:hypothetical protein